MNWLNQFATAVVVVTLTACGGGGSSDVVSGGDAGGGDAGGGGSDNGGGDSGGGDSGGGDSGGGDSGGGDSGGGDSGGGDSGGGDSGGGDSGGGDSGGGNSGGGGDSGGGDGGVATWPDGQALFNLSNGPFDSIEQDTGRIVKVAGYRSLYRVTNSELSALNAGRVFSGSQYGFEINALTGPELLAASALKKIAFEHTEVVDISGRQVSEFLSVATDSQFPAGSVLVRANRIDTWVQAGSSNPVLLRTNLFNQTAYKHLFPDS